MSKHITENESQLAAAVYARRRAGQTLIGKTWYTSFSLERVDMGGNYSKKDAIALLKENGIKVTTTDAYTPYVGHYALWVEADKADKASELLF